MPELWLDPSVRFFSVGFLLFIYLRTIFFIFFISMLMGLSISANAVPIKAAFVFIGPAEYAGWSRSHELGRQYVEKKFGAAVETESVEFVPEGRKAKQVLENLAKKNDIIFTTSWGYMIASESIAKKYPQVKFEQAIGSRSIENVTNYANRAYEPRYLAGKLAGKMTKTGKVGYVAAHPVPEVIRGLNAFALGVRSVNPDAEIAVEWTSAWYNPEKSSYSAQVLIDAGADVLTHHTDSSAVAKIAEENKVYVIGYHSDMSDFAPNYHLASVIHNWGPYYTRRIQALINGDWQAENNWQGLKSSMAKMTSLSHKIPLAVRKILQATEAKIIAGDLQVFTGPIANTQGRTRVRSGKVLNDEKLQRMNWYVEGITGNLKVL